MEDALDKINLLEASRNTAEAEIEADGHNGPYDLICRSGARADRRLLIANTGIMAQEKIQQMHGAGGRIWTSDNLYTSAGSHNNRTSRGARAFLRGVCFCHFLPLAELLQENFADHVAGLAYLGV